MVSVSVRRAVVGVAIVAAAAAALSACTAKKVASSPATQGAGATATLSTPAPSVSSSAPVVLPASLTLAPTTGAKAVDPSAPVSVGVAGGTIETVALTNSAGKAVKGALSADKLSWKSAEPLGYSKSYTLTATAANASGEQVSKKSTFTTVSPSNMTMPYIYTAAGQTINAGVTYGVGQVVKVHFDEPITDKKTAQNAVKITTSPAQVGGFSWLGSDQDLYWRTKSYLTSGTKVTIAVKAYGVRFGPGLYGQADSSTWFKVGKKQISIADDNTKEVKVYQNDKLVKTMPTSMGRHTSIQGDDSLIDLRTNSGPHVVIDSETNIDMNSASFGLSKGANSYKTIVPVGVKISYDGEYVHWADWSVWAQGNTDTSHGCLNVSPANSYWFAAFSQPGDIVDVKNTGRQLDVMNSGYWVDSWAKWTAGAA